jgi:hypothetical protein
VDTVKKLTLFVMITMYVPQIPAILKLDVYLLLSPLMMVMTAPLTPVIRLRELHIPPSSVTMKILVPLIPAILPVDVSTLLSF